MNDLIDRFMALYTGLDRAYGQWIANINKARFIKKPVERKNWIAHMDGITGLGIVPIRDDDTCTWGAIDIDVDTIDHGELVKRVCKAEMPLMVCRSKSGGAHCYIFTKDPVPAAAIRKALAGYASLLGHGQSEIFPKQDTLGDGLGSWINLPYFSGNRTNRYAVDDEGEPLSVEDFIMAAETMKAETTIKAVKHDAKEAKKGMPPCLKYFDLNGIPEGARNEVLFNFAVFLKKSKPDTWEEEFIKVNTNKTKIPLPNKEVQSLLKSLAKKAYNYKCKVPLISNHCDRVTCMTLDFGMRDLSNYHEFMFGGITKVTTDPPYWILDVNGVDVRMSTTQLYNFESVRMRCIEVLGGIIPPMKNEEWRQLLQMKMSNELDVQEAPKDAGESGRVMAALYDFARMAIRAKSKADLVHGIPVLDRMRIEDRSTKEWDVSDVVLFRSTDFITYMQRRKVVAFAPGHDLWPILREAGCGHQKVRSGKRIIQAWYLPVSAEFIQDMKAQYAAPEVSESEM
ncbi:MAG: hypothetical protein C4534_06080 [Gaiellales bacterium]|nr:MAG: hypothetical protein C4534_06080 [Gaiellales bacterium]